MEPRERKVAIYETSDGKIPYQEWFNALRDKRTKALVLNRIDRVGLGNFGNCRSVGLGVYELKIYHGPGIRVYFGLEGSEVVILLCGGDKSTQSKDISTAHKLWMEYKNNAS
jgi:putative addiction module killer protein